MNLPISDRICDAVDDLEMVSGKNAVNKGETSVVAVTHSRVLLRNHLPLLSRPLGCLLNSHAAFNLVVCVSAVLETIQVVV